MSGGVQHWFLGNLVRGDELINPRVDPKKKITWQPRNEGLSLDDMMMFLVFPGNKGFICRL